MKNRYFFSALFLFIAAHLLQAQPVLVKSISRQAKNFTALGNLLFYTSNDSLFKSDGTSSGTVFIKAGINGTPSYKAYNGLLYFITYPNYDLWRSDGTSSGTYILSSPDPSNKMLEYRGESGTKLLFTKSDATYGTELFITDGTVSGTSILKDIYSGSSSSSPRFLGKIGSTLFFSATNLDSSSIAQPELWKTDGTTGGTVMVKDINPSGGSIPSNTSSAVMSAHLFFLANDGTHGTELWKSDGTSGGTVLVKDIVPGTGGGYEYYEGSTTITLETPTHITEAGGIIYFIAGNVYGTPSGDQVRLWKSDGTDSGTVLVKNMNTETVLSTFELNNKLIIHSKWSVKSQFWRSDGTPAGTIKLKDNDDGGDNYYEDFRFVNNTFLFSENYQGGNYSFWKMNGDPYGTTSIAGLYDAPGDVETVGNNLFYTDYGVEPDYYEDVFEEIDVLWRVNLSTRVVTKIKDIADLPFESSGNLTDVNGTLYFTSNKGNSTPGYQTLWKYEIVPYVPPVTIVPSGLILVNADTDADIRNLNNIDTVYMNQNVAIRSTIPSGTHSVRFYVNNVLTRTENSAPYALNGDASGDFSPWNKLPGLYTITAIAYTGLNGTGTPIDTMVSQISVPLIPDPITFILVDANADTDIRTMVKGEVLSIPASAKITIRVEPTSAAQSVVFNNGHIENTAPYSIIGDSGGDYYEWTGGTSGTHILIVKAYSGANGTGNLIQSDTIYFGISRTSSKIVAHPNPVSDYTVVETENAAKGEAEIQLTDNFGRIYLQQKVMMEAGSNTIPVNTNSLPVGIYFLKISSETEQRVVKIYKQ